MKCFSLILSISSCLVGCTVEDRNPFNSVEETQLLSSSRIIELEECDILRVDDVDSYKGSYIFQDIVSRSSKYTLLSNDLKTVKKGISQGQGRGEVEMVVRMSVCGDSLYVMQPNARKLSTVTVSEESLDMSDFNDFNSMIGVSYQALPNGNFIMSSVDNASLLSLTDHDGNVLSTIGSPDFGDIPEMCLSNILGNTYVVVSPDGTHYAYGMMYSQSFGFGSVVDNSLRPIADKNYNKVLIDYSNSQRVVISKDNVLSFIDAASSEKYAIFLYCGKTYSRDNFNANLVLLYDWNGKNYKWLKLDHALISVGYDLERHVLFGLSEMPEICLVEYNIEL